MPYTKRSPEFHFRPKFRWKRLRKPLVCFGKADRLDSCLLATV